MPYVNIKITDDGVTREQKERIVKDVTSSLVDNLEKRLEHIHIVINEVSVENWGFAEMPTDEFRGKGF